MKKSEVSRKLLVEVAPEVAPYFRVPKGTCLICRAELLRYYTKVVVFLRFRKSARLDMLFRSFNLSFSSLPTSQKVPFLIIFHPLRCSPQHFSIAKTYPPWKSPIHTDSRKGSVSCSLGSGGVQSWRMQRLRS